MHLILVVGNNFSEFVLDVVRVDCLATNASKSLGGICESPFLDIITRGFWEDEQSRGDNDGPQKLDGNGNSIRASVCEGISNWMSA